MSKFDPYDAHHLALPSAPNFYTVRKDLQISLYTTGAGRQGYLTKTNININK
jgi:hypothetical protein